MDDGVPLTAVLDANVLFPPSLRDILLCSAERGLFRPYWSEDILEELRRNLVGKAGVSEAAAIHLVCAMTDAFPDALVLVDPGIMPGLLNDPKDRHVLSAAIVAAVPVIVTENVRDFPPESLEPYRIEAWTADTFLTCLLLAFRDEMLAALIDNAVRLRRPSMEPAELVKVLSRHVPEFARRAAAAL